MAFGTLDMPGASPARRPVRAALAAALVAIALALGATPLSGCSGGYEPREEAALDLASVPSYTGSPYTEIDGNEPSFSSSEVAEAEQAARDDAGFERYTELDGLGRCGEAYAVLGPETRPTEDRESISEIHPTGWEQEFYEFIEDPGDGEEEALYNRCHLIAFSLGAENDNDRNLVTGTRYLNTEGMLPFENGINRYIDDTGNHVLYRVTPMFAGDELVCRGVHLEALSVEDAGAGVRMNVFCYNVQPGVTIDYTTGENHASESTAIDDAGSAQPTPSEQAAPLDGGDAAQPDEGAASVDPNATYVLNTSSMRFHLPTCDSVDEMAADNREAFYGTRDEAIALGYEPCGNCTP